MASKIKFVLLIGLCLCDFSQQSPPLYSLQPAVEALSEREAQLALRNEIENGNIDDFVDNDFEWNNDYDNLENEQRLQVPPNKALARYLARPNTDFDEFYPSDYRKRSMYRKRDSVFRERSRSPSVQLQQQQILAEKFLRAIEDERQKEEEGEYRKQLRNLWNRYQVEEGDIEKELFDEENESDYPLNNDDAYRKKNRQHGEVEVAPYWNDKRSMPLLPWLPASRKKRFPVAKRSPKEILPQTSEKVSQDLKGIFGETEKHGVADDNKMKKKRSNEAATATHAVGVTHKDEKSEIVQKYGNVQPHVHMASKKRKRDTPTEQDDDEDTESDNDNEEEAEEDAGGEDVDDSSEDESKKKKKKRETTKTGTPGKNLKVENKSFQWSSIFGLDRKKKSVGLIYHPLEDVDSRKRKKRCDAIGCDEEDYNEEDYEDEDYRRKKKRSKEEKLDVMDKKLKAIENLIIEDTAKYYENHDGSLSPLEARTLKNRIAERVATAYSLEKMRKAIAHLKQSMEIEKNLERNLLGGSGMLVEDEEDKKKKKKKKAKRVAIKKEKAEFDNTDHDIDSPAKKASSEPHKNDLNEEEENKKKKKKRANRSGDLANLINDEGPPMSEGYMGGRMSNECPLLDGIEKKCRRIFIMSGDSGMNLLEACGVHQLCYLCGDSQMQCDYEYMNDAEEVCGHDLTCKIAAHEGLTLLRSLSTAKVSPRECIRNPCINMALRSIGF